MPNVTRAMMLPETQQLQRHFVGLLDGSRPFDRFIEHIRQKPHAYQMQQVELALDAIPRNRSPMKNRRILRAALVHMVLDAVRRRRNYPPETHAIIDRYAHAIAQKQLFRPDALGHDAPRVMRELERQADVARDALIRMPSFKRFIHDARLHHLKLSAALSARPRRNRSGKIMHESMEWFRNIVQYIQEQHAVGKRGRRQSPR